MPPKKQFVPKQPDLNNEGGYLRIRRGIWKHIKDGRLTGNDYNVYQTIHNFADITTGICFSNATSLSEAWGNFSTVKRKHVVFQDAMRRLRDNGYIDYPDGGAGEGNSYNILIDKAEPTRGLLYGWRLRLLEGENDFTNPRYQYNSPTPMVEAYGFDIEVQTVAWRVVRTAVQTVVQMEEAAEDRLQSMSLQDIQNVFKTGKTLRDGKDVQLPSSPSSIPSEQFPTNPKSPSASQRYNPPPSPHYTALARNGWYECNYCNRQQSGEIIVGHFPNCPNKPAAEEIEFLDETKASTTFNLDEEDDDLA